MTKHPDHQLALALVHDAYARCSGGKASDLVVIAEELLLAECLLSGRATDDDRARVSSLVHPSTRSNFLL